MNGALHGSSLRVQLRTRREMPTSVSDLCLALPRPFESRDVERGQSDFDPNAPRRFRKRRHVEQGSVSKRRLSIPEKSEFSLRARENLQTVLCLSIFASASKQDTYIKHPSSSLIALMASSVDPNCRNVIQHAEPLLKC
eukprot:scaffold49788_cov64-Cyclotella_meneghiniana.AAC.1